MDKTEVHLDFHIFAILDFDLLIGYPFEKLFQEKPFHGSLSEKLGETAFATPISRLEIPMAKHLPNHGLFKEVKFVSPFVSPKVSYHPCEIEHPSSPSLKLKTCPSGHPNVVLDNGRGSTLILFDISLKNDNFYAMDILLSTTCSYRNHNHISIIIYKLFRRMVVDAFVYYKYCKSRSCIVVLTLQLER